MVLGRKAASASCRLSNNVRINSSEQLAMQSRNQRAPSLIRTTPSTSIIKVTGSTSTEKGRGPTRGKEFQRINEANNKRMAVCIDPVQGRPFDKVQSAQLSSDIGIVSREFMTCPISCTKLTK